MTLQIICVTLLWIAVAGAAYYYGRAEESRRWCAAENDALEECKRKIMNAQDFQTESEVYWYVNGMSELWVEMQSSEEKHHVL